MRQKLKRFARIFLPILVLCAGIYGVLAYRYWSNPPKLTHNYAAELNAPILKFPEDERAWPFYREAIIELLKDAPPAWTSATDYEAILADHDAKEHVRRNASALAKVREAGKLPALGYLLSNVPSPDDRRLNAALNTQGAPRRETQLETPDENPHLMNVWLNSVTELRRLKKTLQADAFLAAEEGDALRMRQDLQTLLAFPTQMRELPITVNELVAVSLFSEFLKTWGLLLENYPQHFSAAQLLELEAAATSFADGAIHPRFTGERFMFYDVIQRCFSDDGRGDGFFRATDGNRALGGLNPSAETPFLAPLITWQHLSRREIIDEFDELIDAIDAKSREPYWSADFADLDLRLDALRLDPRRRLISLFLIGLSNVHVNFENVVQQRDAIVAMSAAHRFRLDHGDWPPTFDALVPDYLADVPVDRIAGKPLMYRIVDDRPLVYALGFDGKDDGGRAAKSKWTHREMMGAPLITETRHWHWSFSVSHRVSPPDGDLILWPVESKDDVQIAEPTEP